MKNPYAIKNPYAKKGNTSNNHKNNNSNDSNNVNINKNNNNYNNRSSSNRNPISNSRNDVFVTHTRGRGQEEKQMAANVGAATAKTIGNAHVDSGYVAATFSQEFESIEESKYFQNCLSTTTDDDAVKNPTQGSSRRTRMMPDEERLEREQQKNMDSETATTAATSIETMELSDRDYHVFFQKQPHVLYVSTKQRGNGVLRYIRNVPYVYSRMVPDYVMSPTRCALFLSMKYHNLHPQYIHRRIAELKNDFTLRILLVLADVDDNQSILVYLNKICAINSLTLIVSWTEEEAGRYLETYKAMDGKDASLIQRKEKTTFVDQVADYLCGTTGASGLTTSTGINKTDSGHLLSQFNSVRSIMAASMDELALVPGIGQVKVKRLYEAFHKPFSKQMSRKRRKQKTQQQQQQQQQQQEQQKEAAKIATTAKTIPSLASSPSLTAGKAATTAKSTATETETAAEAATAAETATETVTKAAAEETTNSSSSNNNIDKSKKKQQEQINSSNNSDKNMSDDNNSGGRNRNNCISKTSK